MARKNAPFGGRNAVRAMLADARGSILPIGAAAVLVLSMAGFAAYDFHAATTYRSNLQDALDGVALTVARSSEQDPAKLNKLGEKLLQESLHKSAARATLGKVKFTEIDGVIHAQAELSFSPVIAGMVTQDTITMNVTSTVAPGDRLEIALVLDNTYSMAGTRIATLKTAATNFVSVLERSAAMSRDRQALKISLVPFATTVNVGSGYRSASWMDTQALSPIHDDIFNQHANRFTLFSQIQVNWAGCVESRPAPYDVQDTAPTASNGSTLFVPYFAPDEYDGWDPNYTDTVYWVNNYLPDDLGGTDWALRQKRTAKYDQAPASRTYIGSGYYRGPNYECTLKPLLRLTTDGARVKQAIADLTVAGDTNIPMGLVWGWHTLSPVGPFADGAPYRTPKTKKIAVLMTDGQNTIFNNNRGNQSIYSGIGYIGQNRVGITSGTADQRRAALDSRLALLCANMKREDILIYTIRLEVNDSDYEVLRNCASHPGMFFDVKAAGELTGVFETIAKDINRIRIAR